MFPMLPTSLLLLAGAVVAQQPAWAQCGGSGYGGATTCVSGYTCASVNAYYSQCQPGTAAPAPAPVSASASAQPQPPQSSAAPLPSGSQAPAPAPAPAPGAPGTTVRFLGRVNPATKELTWAGTGIAFSFTGTSATIGLAAVSGTNSVDLSIDGGKPQVISNVAGTSITTPAGLAHGTHTVVLQKRSEPIFGTITIGTVTTDGSLVSTVAPARQIEVVGDSISVGYGIDGVNPCSNNAAVENNPLTYAALSAKALGADYSTIAWSGKGIVRNIATGSVDTSPLMPELYGRYGANDADGTYTFPASWSPGAVVINLGTNDFSYLGYTSTGSSFKARDSLDVPSYTAAVVKFAQGIQAHYPDAHFFLLSSPMLSDFFPTAADAQKTTQVAALKAAVAQIGAKAQFVDWPSQGSAVGCDYHPNADTHAAEAAVLTAAIKATLGW